MGKRRKKESKAIFITPLSLLMVLQATVYADNINNAVPAIMKIGTSSDTGAQNIARFFVARVLFSETASCTDKERFLVASVIKNRVNNKAFGSLNSMKAVTEYSNAFECVNDSDNSNWEKTAYPENLTKTEKGIWNKCFALALGDFEPATGPSGRAVVYYHDKSIDKPRGLTNRWWKAVPEIETDSFIFYSVIPAKRKRIKSKPKKPK